MPKEFHAERLDVQAFAEASAALTGQTALGTFSRLMADTEGRGADRRVAWSARGEVRGGGPARSGTWLYLQAQALLPLTCQRCLEPVDTPVAVDRAFRFVADEATAAAEDDEAEEDVLASSRTFDLPALIEDELLMALPLVPAHAPCPRPVRLQAADPGFEEESPPENPFAVLQRLKDRGS